MWIITDQGFYSIVHKPYNQPDILTVRCRVRADMESFCKQVKSASPIREDTTADYRYRVIADRAEIAAWIGKQALNIRYDNFKSHVGKKQGWNREGVYARVWLVLLGLGLLKE